MIEDVCSQKRKTSHQFTMFFCVENGVSINGQSDNLTLEFDSHVEA